MNCVKKEMQDKLIWWHDLCVGIFDAVYVFLTVIYSYVYIADKIGDYELFYIIISDLHMLDSMHYDALYAYTTHTMQKCKLAVISPSYEMYYPFA